MERLREVEEEGDFGVRRKFPLLRCHLAGGGGGGGGPQGGREQPQPQGEVSHKLLGPQRGVVAVALREGDRHARRLETPNLHGHQVASVEGGVVGEGGRAGPFGEVVPQKVGEGGGERVKVALKVGELLGEVRLEHPPFPEPLHGRAEVPVLHRLPQGAVAHVYGGRLDLEGLGPPISLDAWDGHGYLKRGEGKIRKRLECAPAYVNKPLKTEA